MSNRGGVRPGAGRKSRLEKYIGPISSAEQRIADRLPELIDNLLALAGGVWVEVEDKDGSRRIYAEPPDRAANEYLINRIVGKPTERVEHDGDDAKGSDTAVLMAVVLEALAPYPDAKIAVAAALAAACRPPEPAEPPVDTPALPRPGA